MKDPIDDIAENYIDEYPEKSGQFFSELSPDDLADYLDQVDNRIILKVIPYIRPSLGALVLDRIGASRASGILNNCPLNLVADICRAMPKKFFKMIQFDTEGKRKKIENLIIYKGGTAGSLMDANILSVDQEDSVESVFSKFSAKGQRCSYYIYITSEMNRLVGVVTIKELVNSLVKPQSLISSIMQTNVIALKCEMQKMSVLNHAGWSQYHALPVVGNKNQFLGVVQYETIRMIESELKIEKCNSHLNETAKDLGNLYTIGFGLIFGYFLQFFNEGE